MDFGKNSGMAMMMKAIGFDPDKLGEMLNTAGSEVKKVVAHFDDRFNRIEATLKAIEARLPPPALTVVEKENGTNG